MDVLKSLVFVCLMLLLVQCDNNRDEGGSQFIKSGSPQCDDLKVSGEYLVRWKNGNVTVEKYPDDKSFVKDFVKKHSDEIISSEPHYKIYLQPSAKISQRNWGGEVNWGVKKIEATSVWANTKKSTDKVIVAVIDSGMDVNHPELQASLAINELEEINGEDDDGNGLIDDRYGYDFYSNTYEVSDYTGHGTHVSGIIGAQHSVGHVLGVAPDVRILPIAFIGRDGGGSVNAAINAIRYAASQNAKVINASWGGPNCSLQLKEEIVSLAEQNVIFVSAAGNSGNDLDIFPEYPAAFVIDNQITVGASTYDDKTAAFSNYGDLVDIVAPGANIVSTYPPEYDEFDEFLDGMTSQNGTSMAAPFVSAAAALLWSQAPDATYIEIKQALLDGVEPGPFPVQSRGQLNIRRSLQKLIPSEDI